MAIIAYVVEYPDGEEPSVHAGMEIAGGELVAVQFNDALEELDGVYARLGEALFNGN